MTNPSTNNAYIRGTIDRADAAFLIRSLTAFLEGTRATEEFRVSTKDYDEDTRQMYLSFGLSHSATMTVDKMMFDGKVIHGSEDQVGA